MNAEKRSFWANPWLRRAVQWLFLFLGVGGLIYLLDRIGWQQFGEYLQQLSVGGVILLLFFGILENLCDAVALQAATPEPARLWRVLGYNQVGALFNRLIPWEVGEVLKGTLMCREVSSHAAISGTVVWNYLFKLTKPTTTMLAALTGWLLGPAALRETAGWTVLACLVAFLPYVALFVLLRIGLAGILVSLLRRLRILRRDPEAAVARARQIDTAVRQFRRDRPGSYWRILAFQVVARLVSWAALYVALLLITDYHDPALSGTIWAAMNVFSYFVALLPTRLGTTEAGGYAVFAVLGLDGGLGLTTQCILSAKAIFLTGLTSLLALRRSRRNAPAGSPSPAAASNSV